MAAAWPCCVGFLWRKYGPVPCLCLFDEATKGQVRGNSAFGVAAVWLTAFGYVVASVDIRGTCERCTIFGWGQAVRDIAIRASLFC